ncbi:AMMECR1 domain-containing protein [Sulfurimonas sp.]|nr:AMMECR1 domain-containing protein [Sulfurimonas sp.]
MSRSVLLQIARDSIQEVLEANRTIDRQLLVEQHPLLNEKIATTVNLYIEDELRGSSSTKMPSFSLIDDIIKNAKQSAFENESFPPITTSEYLNCELEIVLLTSDGPISEKDPAILKTTSYSLEDELR